MPQLTFFSRVAFICNLCFLVTFLLRFAPSLKDGVIVSTIITLGLVVAIVLNAIINLIYLFIKLNRKPVSKFVPLWLVITNFLFFIFQAILLLK